MKTKLFFLPILALTATLSVSAQQIESDDMYFNAKDRTKEKTSRASSLSTNNDIVARGIKSNDQYSGRTVNPEYTSRLNANSNTVQGSSNPYFDSDYQATNNSGYYNGYNSPYYGNSFNNPYYGNSWNSPYYSPYSSLYGYSGMYGAGMYGSGMYGFSPYSNFYSSFYSPFGYASGLSMGIGFGNGFYSPYGYNSMMYGYGGGFGYGYPYYYPGTVIITNGGDSRSNMVYGKRSSRSSTMDNSTMSNRRRISTPVSSNQGGAQYSIPTSGRTSSSPSSSQQYYQPNWRNNPDVNATNSSSRQSSGTYNRSQSLGTQNPSWNSTGTNSRPTQNPGWNTTRQSVPANNNNFGTPSRGSSMPSWGGSGGGGSVGGSSGHSSSGSRGRN